MSKKEFVCEAIQRLGFKPEIDEDGDVFFFFQMKKLFVVIGEEEEPMVSVVHPIVAELDGEDDVSLAMAVINRVNRSRWLSKLYLDRSFEYVSATVDFIYHDEHSFDFCFKKALDNLKCVKRYYNKTKSELMSSLED